MYKHLFYKFLPNPFTRQLTRFKKEGKKRFLVLWNRGLGDIPLGLYAFCYHIRKIIPNAQITFITREDLKEAFTLLEGVDVFSSSFIQRGKQVDVTQVIESLGLLKRDFEVVIEKIDSSRWLYWQIGNLVPKLAWDEKWDALSEPFLHVEEKNCLAVHVSSQTNEFYQYEKNWPKKNFERLFSEVKNQKILLFGFQDKEMFPFENIVDLRGKTTVIQMLCLIKNHCSHLLAPDSGILNMLYYLNQNFPIKVVSLWSDPNQGILKQKVASPNKELLHLPLIGESNDVSTLTVEKVLQALYH